MLAPDMGIALGFALVLVRCTCFFVTGPVISAHLFPVRARLALSVITALAAFAAAGAPSTSFAGWGALFAAGGVEATLGLASGLGARAAIEAANAAGNIAGLGLGLGFASFFDPNAGTQTNAVGELFGALALAAAVALGVHREAIAWLVSSVIATHGAASSLDVARVITFAIVEAIRSTALGVRLAFPFLVVGCISQLALGVASRFAPQVHLQNVGFALPLLLGGFVARELAAPIAEIAAKGALEALHSLS